MSYTYSIEFRLGRNLFITSRRRSVIFAVSANPPFEKTAMKPVVGIVLLSVLLFCPILPAQQVYKGWPLTAKTEEAESKKAAAITTALQNGSIDKATFDSYFNKYYFSRWTQPDRIGQINGYVRNDLIKNDLGKATGEARRMLLERTALAMKKMKSDPNVYPVAQLNAVIALSNLYEDTGKTMPYGPAIPLLIEEVKSQKSSEANKIAALDGLVRYAYLGIQDPKIRDSVLPELFISTLNEKTVPAGRDEAIHNLFFRARSAKGLGALCRSAKPAAGDAANGIATVVEALLTVLEDKEEKNADVRTNAMNAFAELNLIAASAGGVKLDSDRIVDAITAFTRATCDSQQRYIEEVRRSEQANTSTRGMGGGMGGMSGGMGGMMGSDMGGMSGGMGGMGMGSSGDSKSIRRIEDCIASSKFAFESIQNAIRGLAGGRNETSIIALLNKENAAENAGTVKMLNDVQKNIDDYVNFLDKGPQTTGGKKQQRGNTASMGGMGSGMGGISPVGGSGNAAAKNVKLPKVTMLDIYNELTVLATKFDELFTKNVKSVAVK